jgi:hypothetical protein
MSLKLTRPSKQSVRFQSIDRTNDMSILGFNLSLAGSYDFGNPQRHGVPRQAYRHARMALRSGRQS